MNINTVHTGHGRTVYRCGHVYQQCRCMENHIVRTLAADCPKCQNKVAAPNQSESDGA